MPNLSPNYKFIDLTHLNEVAGGDPTFVFAILSKVLQQFPVAIADLEKAVENKDFPQVKAIAHKTKSTVVHIGNRELSEILGNMEHFAETGRRLEALPDRMAQVKKIAGPIQEDLKRACENVKTQF